MKLLLTSAGVTNSSIATELQKLVGKPAQETKVALVPTAANVEAGNKDWFVAQFTNLWNLGFTWVDMVDPSAPGTDWQTRLKEVDVIFVSGGNTFHLLDQAHKTGFDIWLNKNLESKVYVGVSAGTIIASPNIEVCTIPPADENIPNLKDLSGFGWVDFEIEPHCEGERFALMKNYALKKGREVYAIDDQTAIKVVGSKVEVISEGKWEKYS